MEKSQFAAMIPAEDVKSLTGTNTVRFGAGVPADTLGVDGDVYIRTATAGSIYQKASGAWGSAKIVYTIAP